MGEGAGALDYPKGVLVAGAGPPSQHWALSSERARQDQQARVAWAQRCEDLEAAQRAERAVAQLEEQARARAEELAKEGRDFVVAGLSEAPEAAPEVAQRGADSRDGDGGTAARGAAADRFNITPRGTGGIVIDKAAAKADRIRPPEVQVRVRVGTTISDAEADESTRVSTGSRRRGRSRSAAPDGTGRPRTAGSATGSLLRSASPPEHLDGPEPAVWQGNNTDAMEPGAGVAMRVGNELRRGPSLAKDPMRLTRREYLMSRTRGDHETIDARTPTRASHAAADYSAGSSEEEEDHVQPPVPERHWMDDARALDQPSSAEEEEQRQLQQWYSRGRGRHYAFEKQIIEAKAKSAWGNDHAGVPGRRAPVPVLPQKNSRNALLSQAATLSSQGATAVQRSLRRGQHQQQRHTTEKQQRGSASSPLDGFAVPMGDGPARRTRLELASRDLQRHVKSQALGNRTRVAPNPDSPTRAGYTRMAGLPIGGGSRRLASGATSAAASSTSRRASTARRTPVMVVRA
jgi:hypothetical protein